MSDFDNSSMEYHLFFWFNSGRFKQCLAAQTLQLLRHMLANKVDTKKVRIRTSDIPTAWLNARCRNLISKYALLAYRVDGTVFDLRSENLLSTLSRHSRRTEQSDLHEIYRELKNELRNVVAEPSLKTAVNIMAEKLSFLETGPVQ